MSEKLILRSRKPNYEIPLQSVGETVWKRFKAFNSNQTCIIDARNDKKLTVGELLTQANSIAIALLNRGITKSDRFCCFSVNNIPYAVLHFAAYFLGITLVPLSPTFNVYELKQEIKNSGSTVIFTSVKNAHYFDDFVKNYNKNEHIIKFVVIFDGNYSNYLPFNQLLEEGKNQTLEKIPHFNIDPKNDIFMLMFSSGSTGLPKCAIISHYTAVAMFLDMTGPKQLPKDPIVSGSYSFGHVSGSIFIPVWIIGGSTFVIYGEYDKHLILQSIQKYRINYLPTFPAFGRKLIEGEFADKYDFSSLRMIMTGGTAFPGNVAKAIIHKYNVIFKEAYGMTEYLPITEWPDTDPIEYIPGNTGYVSRNTQLKVRDLNTDQSLGPNIDGEICVRGSKIFSGYLNNIQETNNTIDSEGWLHTGDIGHYDQNERIFITDRLKQLIKFDAKWGQINISPVEMEQFLLTHESVAEVAVVGVKHETQSEWPRAYVKVKEGKSITEEELKKFVSDTMSYVKQLRAGVVFVDNIPRLSAGKIDRKYFKQLVNNELIRDTE